MATQQPRDVKEKFLKELTSIRIHFLNGSYVDGTLIAFDSSAIIIQASVKSKLTEKGLKRHIIPEGNYLWIEEM